MTGGISGQSSPNATVVTLFGTYGAGAHEVGSRVAKALGLPYHRQAFSSQTLAGSREADAAELALLARVVDVLGRAHSALEPDEVAETERLIHKLVMENDRQVWAAAEEGGVIVGRNGPVVLAGRPATLHVLLTGQVEDRIARAAADFAIPREEAARRREPEDEIRADMSIVLYGWDPREPERYDLVIDTSRNSLDAAVATILDAVRSGDS
jgi:cytidylate kinase